MAKQGLTWKDAVLRVLGEASGPMRVTDIATKILDDGLRPKVKMSSAVGSVSTAIPKLIDEGGHGVMQDASGAYYIAGRARKMSWEDAILRVLREAARPMHYRDIAAKILDDRLVDTVSKTPSATVAGTISRLITDDRGDIVKVRPGVYGLRGGDGVAVAKVATDADDALDAVDAHDTKRKNLSVAAYGLHWERDKVDWSSGKLLGLDDANSDADLSQSIDFSGQRGVYLLHSWDGVAYVGMTAAKDDGLFNRLKSHHEGYLYKEGRRVQEGKWWASKWVRFSWFGLLRVDESGELIDEPSEEASMRVVAALMESVLIEALRPAFNGQSGDYMGTLYRQVIDPKIAEQQARAVLSRAIAPA